MSISNILVLLAAVLCTCLSQAKFVRRPTRRGFSFLGGLACLVSAAEASLRDDAGATAVFGCAAAINLLIAAFNYPQPAKDEQ